MKTHFYLLFALPLAWLPHALAGAGPLTDALQASTPLVDWRLRRETVDQQGFAGDADALTSRVRAGLKTGSLRGTRLLAEAVWMADVGGDYNSTTNGNSAFPVVPDPAGFVAVNRFALTNESLERTTFTLGRQRIVHDDARFVGNVGWRQNEQTFDAVRMRHSGERFSADVAYASQVNRIFGPDSPAGRWHGDVGMTRLGWRLPFGTLAAFAYLVDIDEAPALATRTLGVKLSGERPAGALTFRYAAAFAQQADTGANPRDVDADYRLAEAGLGAGRLSARIGVEVLGGDGTAAFTTPLATLHAFQGWADKFLTTPADGLDDRYLSLSYAVGAAGPFTGLSATLSRHSFRADAGAARYGDETDLQIVARTGRLALTLKLARYGARSLATDTDKAWLSVDFAL